MGLDQFWYKTKIKPTSEVDFEINEATDDSEEIYYHRKTPALQDYMTDLYLEKGGENEAFNCRNLRITLEDLEQLEHEVINKNLNEDAGGFFWGKHLEEDYKEIQEAINAAKKALNEGYFVYYTAWY